MSMSFAAIERLQDSRLTYVEEEAKLVKETSTTFEEALSKKASSLATHCVIFKHASKVRSLIEGVEDYVIVRNYLEALQQEAQTEQEFARHCQDIVQKSKHDIEPIVRQTLQKEIPLWFDQHSTSVVTIDMLRLGQFLLQDESLNLIRRDWLTLVNNFELDAISKLAFLDEESVQELRRHAPEDLVSFKEVFDRIVRKSTAEMKGIFEDDTLREILNLTKTVQIDGPVADYFGEYSKNYQFHDSANRARMSRRNTFRGRSCYNLFQALSLITTNFRTESHDVELRAKTLCYLFGNWKRYSAANYAQNQLEQAKAIENLIWSSRRFNPFSCRLVHALPQVLNSRIHFLLQSPNGSWSTANANVGAGAGTLCSAADVHLLIKNELEGKGNGHGYVYSVQPIECLPRAINVIDRIRFNPADAFV